MTITNMNVLYNRALTLMSLLLLCVTLTYWAITLTARHAELSATAQRASTPIIQAEALFGGQHAAGADRDIHLSGILNFNWNAAAIVSVGIESSRAIPLGSEIMQGAKLYEVRPKSIVIERNGSLSEVFLPASGAAPSIYLR